MFARHSAGGGRSIFQCRPCHRYKQCRMQAECLEPDCLDCLHRLEHRLECLECLQPALRQTAGRTMILQSSTGKFSAPQAEPPCDEAECGEICDMLMLVTLVKDRSLLVLFFCS